ncbi:OmpA family protein [Azonexus sp.]|uniref:OmpA family protein n=1 Tax=Azonexus sp. TaxID=1872668 RepID=UPI0035AF183F
MPTTKLVIVLGAVLLLGACAAQPPVSEAPPPETQPVRSDASRPASNPAQEEKAAMAAVDVDNSVFFASSGNTIDAEGRQRLLEHAARLKADPELVVTLVGHADHLGSRSYNLAIAEQRINAVFAVLRGAGIPVTQIRREAVGSEEVSPACRSPQCRKLMRRVQLVYQK